MTSTTESISWEDLKLGIREAFSRDRVDVDEVKQLMSSYVSRREDWEKYEHFDKHTYTRNLVDKGNGQYNLIVLCWDSGQGSSIHDHADSHCFMKVLSGCLKETVYEWPEKRSVTGMNDGEACCNDATGDVRPLKRREEMIYCKDDITYINNTIGLHRIENHTHTDPAVTLHLYIPPIEVCKCFEERTGSSHSCKVTFYTSCPSSSNKE